MKHLLRNKFLSSIIVLLLLYVGSVVINLGYLEFAGEEPRRAMISVEMLDTGNFIKPVQYGWNYYNKPPVFNWVLAVVIWLTDSTSEFVLRLPSLIFYMLMALLHYKVSRQFFSRQIAILSAFFVLTSGDVYIYGLAYGAEIDIFYSLIVYLQAISIFWFYTKRQYLSLYLFSYLFCAIGFLTKAFPSLIFQSLSLLTLCVYARSVRPLFHWKHVTGILLFLLLTGCYFLLYSKYSSPLRFLINLFNEAILKSGVGEGSDNVLVKSAKYPLLIIKLFAPWSLLLLLLFKRINYGFKKNPLVLFSLLFIGFNLWVYWFTGEPKIRYVYMFVPFFCTIVVHIYQHYTLTYPGKFEKLLKYAGYLFVLPLCALVAAPFFSDVQVSWVMALATAFACLLYCYYRSAGKRIWWFVAGFMLLRLMYAVVFIPIQDKGIESYNDHAVKAAQATNKMPLQYWADATALSVGVATKLFTYQSEVVKMPVLLPLEIPYYYYRNTGTIIRFDTVQKHTPVFISFAWQLNGKKVDTLYAFTDKNFKQRVVFYKLTE